VSELPVHRFPGRDGVDLAYRETGEGRPLVLLHGFFSTAGVNWIRHGHAATIAARGFRVIMPDLRGHGDSAKPHDPAAYPRDVLTDDAFALIDHLGLADYDLGGYSLGGRTTARMLARGATPGRAVIAGMGLDGIVDTADRGGVFYRTLTNPGTFERGTPEWKSERFLRAMNGDPQALLHVLDTSVDTPPEALAAITTPTLVVCGADDDGVGDPQALAELLPNGRYTKVPGDHMSAVAQRDLGEAIAAYLAEPR